MMTSDVALSREKREASELHWEPRVGVGQHSYGKRDLRVVVAGRCIHLLSYLYSWLQQLMLETMCN